MTTRSAEHAIAMIERYALAATESRVDDIAACFAQDAELRDPFDGPIIRGRDAIRAFFEVGVAMIDRLAVNGPVRITGDAASASWPSPSSSSSGARSSTPPPTPAQARPSSTCTPSPRARTG
jgi:hypothetical protein